MATPFPALLEERLGIDCVNLGVHSAGVEVFLKDDAILDVARGAEAVIVQAMPAQNQSNALYAVHPRRNDRFLRAQVPFHSLFPEVDLTDIHFTRHLLVRLAAVSEARFETVAAVLADAWIDQMQRLLAAIDRPVIHVWFGMAPPPPSVSFDDPTALVTKPMIECVSRDAAGMLEIVPSDLARQDPTTDMHLRASDAKRAGEFPGALAHIEAAEALAAQLRALRLPAF